MRQAGNLTLYVILRPAFEGRPPEPARLRRSGGRGAGWKDLVHSMVQILHFAQDDVRQTLFRAPVGQRSTDLC
jgi:hypothetical protein